MPFAVEKKIMQQAVLVNRLQSLANTYASWKNKTENLSRFAVLNLKEAASKLKPANTSTQGSKRAIMLDVRLKGSKFYTLPYS